MRETIDAGYARFTLSESLVTDGYRLSHSRVRTPVVGGDDVWIPNYRWPLPADGLSEDDVKDLVQQFDAEARRRYQLKKQRLAVMRRKALLRNRKHEEPDVTVEVERVGGRTLNTVTRH